MLNSLHLLWQMADTVFVFPFGFTGEMDCGPCSISPADVVGQFGELYPFSHLERF